MKHSAKTYGQFLKEGAYVDQDGELQGLEFNDQDKYKADMIDNAAPITDFLEEEGATKIRLKVGEDTMRYAFDYAFQRFSIIMDFEKDMTSMFVTDREGRLQHILTDATESFFDLLSSKGLSFLDR
jgi:hypothetical protein